MEKTAFYSFIILDENMCIKSPKKKESVVRTIFQIFSFRDSQQLS